MTKTYCSHISPRKNRATSKPSCTHKREQNKSCFITSCQKIRAPGCDVTTGQAGTRSQKHCGCRSDVILIVTSKRRLKCNKPSLITKNGDIAFFGEESFCLINVKCSVPIYVVFNIWPELVAVGIDDWFMFNLCLIWGQQSLTPPFVYSLKERCVNSAEKSACFRFMCTKLCISK